jgi:FkbM family methyltransferase
MLIDLPTLVRILTTHKITIKGVLHIGAHECEERPFYNNMLHVSDENILWVDGNAKKVDEMKAKNIHVECAVLDETEREVEFNITDNSQASSLLTLNHEKGFYKNIHIIEKQMRITEKLSTFMKRIGKKSEDYNFWNLDIQGSELNVLRGSQELLINCDAIYTEVNRDYVYKDCGLITELDTLLKNYGFTRVETLWTDVQWGDALYLKI